jgi:hypothetical protein
MEGAIGVKAIQRVLLLFNCAKENLRMRKLLARRSSTIPLIIGFFGMIAIGTAADPIIGSWKLNISKSKFSPVWATFAGPRPKQQIETYREIEGEQIEISFATTKADGSSGSGKVIFASQGGGGGRGPRGDHLRGGETCSGRVGGDQHARWPTIRSQAETSQQGWKNNAPDRHRLFRRQAIRAR